MILPACCGRVVAPLGIFAALAGLAAMFLNLGLGFVIMSIGSALLMLGLGRISACDKHLDKEFFERWRK